VSAIATFLALPRRDRLLLLEAAATIVGVRLALRFVSANRLRGWAGRLKAGATPAERIAWAVKATSRRMAGTTCLVTALALQRLLGGRGHVSELVIGVARTRSEFAAHAWVVCGGEILVGADAGQDYARLLAWRSDD
jgi:hypothetical protein